jgi:hypothetical protein
MNRTFTIIGGILLVAIVLSCDRDARTKEAILGTWVSADQADTLLFLNEEVFEKNSPENGYMTPFLYSIHRDSITVQYNGPNLILVKPSIHYFELEESTLSIDFANGCYGFPREQLIYGR